MASFLETAIDVYRDLAKIPSGVGGGRIEVRENCILVNTVWNHRDLTRNEPVKFLQSYLVYDGEKKNKVSLGSGPTEINEVHRAYTNSDSKIAVFRRIAPVKKSGAVQLPEKSEFLEVFDCESSFKDCTVDLKAAEKHGKLHVDAEIGSVEWSNGEGHLLYVAEKFRKDIGYFDPKFDPSDEEQLHKTPPGRGFEFEQSWGEQLEKVKNPTLCILDVPSGAVSVLENLPDGVTPVEPVWTPEDDGVLFIGLKAEPTKLGRIYCFNRKCALFHYSLAEASCTQFGNKDVTLSSIRFSPNASSFVFFERPAGGPHFGASKLMHCEWPSKNMRVVVDLVQQPETEGSFPGLYCTGSVGLPKRCWASDNRRILLTSIWRSKSEIIVVNTTTGSYRKITNVGESVHGSWTVLDVKADWVLVSCSAPNRAPCVLIGKLPEDGKEELIVWVRLNSDKAFEQLTSNVTWSILGFRRNASDEEEGSYVDTQYEGILIQPGKEEGRLRPLVVIPHGGPHTVCLATWLLLPAFLASMGYAVLRINYRGSSGFGQSFLRSLPGKIGTLDVKDCQHAVETVIAADYGIDGRKVCVLGGSHGGFLSTHLIGQFPEFYKACVAINPVLNVATMTEVTDVTDWTVVEGLGKEFEEGRLLTPDEYKEMWLKSPIRYVEHVKCPVLFLIADCDARVPPGQRNEFWRILRTKNVPCKILYYPENNHVIGQIDAECDYSINILRWFEEWLEKTD